MHNLDEIPRTHPSLAHVSTVKLRKCNNINDHISRHPKVPAYDSQSVLSTIGTVIKHSFGSRYLIVCAATAGRNQMNLWGRKRGGGGNVTKSQQRTMQLSSQMRWVCVAF